MERQWRHASSKIDLSSGRLARECHRRRLCGSSGFVRLAFDVESATHYSAPFAGANPKAHPYGFQSDLLPMSSANFVLYEEESKLLFDGLVRLRQDANARAVFLVDKNGQQIANAGDVAQFDITSLASLTAGNVAATDGLAKLIGEREFSVLFHEGEREHIHISIVAKRAILVVIFDDRSSLGLVRLRVKRANLELERIFEAMLQQSGNTALAEERSKDSPFAEITDEDIDALFRD